MHKFRNLKNLDIHKRLQSGLIVDILAVVLLLTVPLTHKEMFSVYLPDLVISKFIYAAVAGIGFVALLRKKEVRFNIFILLYAIVVAFHIASLMQTRDLTNSIRYVLFQITILGSFVFFVWYLLRDTKKISLILTVSLIALCTSFLFLFVQQYLFEQIGYKTGGIWPVPGYPTRFGSFFWDVNHYAIYVVSWVFCILGILLQYRKHTNRVISILPNRAYVLVLAIIALCSLYALSVTGSRSAFIGAAVAGLFFLVMIIRPSGKQKSYSSRIKKLSVLIPSVAVVALFSVLIVFADAIQKVFLYRAVSFFSHLYLLTTGIRVAADHLLTGIGTNAFHAYFKTSEYAQTYYYIDAAALNQKLPLHNLWLETLAETGMVSFLFFVFFWMCVIGALIRVYLAKRDYIALSFAAGLVAYLVAGFMYSYKSEFFTVYVAIAAAYATSQLFLTEKQTLLGIRQQMRAIFGSLNFISSFIIALCGLCLFLLPLFTIIAPLSTHDIQAISQVSTLLPYTLLSDAITLFRYLFGNYSYVPRMVPAIFYLATFFTLFLVSRQKRVSASMSLFFAGISVFLLNFGYLFLEITPYWGYVFVFITTAACVVAFSKKEIRFQNQFARNPAILTIGVMLITALVCTFGYVRSQEALRDRYPEGTSFLLELAHNRRIFHESTIITDETVSDGLFQFYCEDIYHVNGAYLVVSCDRMRGSSDQIVLPESARDTYIGSPSFIARYKQILTGIRKVTVLERGDTGILISKPLSLDGSD